MKNEKITKVELERVKDFISEFYLAVGISITAGVVLNFSIDQAIHWFFLTWGMICILFGSYIRFAKVEPENINIHKIRFYGNLVNAFNIILFGTFSILFLVIGNLMGFISFLIILIAFTILLNKIKKI